MNLGTALLDQMAFDRAAQHFAAASAATREVNGRESVSHSRCLRMWGIASGDISKLREAIAIERKIEAKSDLLASLMKLGSWLASQGDHAAAIPYLREAISLHQPRPGQRLEDLPHLQLASVYRKEQMGADYQQAIRAAIQAAQTASSRDRAGWRKLGKSLRKEGHMDESILALLVADSLPKSGKETENPAHYLGLNYWDLRELKLAESYLRKGIEEAKEEADWDLVYRDSKTLAEILAKADKYTDAIPLFEYCLENDRSRAHATLASMLTFGLENVEVADWLASYRKRLERKLLDPKQAEGVFAAKLLSQYALFEGDLERCFEMLAMAGLKAPVSLGNQYKQLMYRGHFRQGS